MPSPSDALSQHNITVRVINGPFPRVLNTWRGIGYTIEVMQDERSVLTTEYSLGIGHVKLPTEQEINSIIRRNFTGMSKEERNMLEAWARKPHAKFVDKDLQLNVAVKLAKNQKLVPKIESVMYSLVQDSDVLDFADFADWAYDFGYDVDSISALDAYRECLGIALKLRAGLGQDTLLELQEAFHDY